MEGLHIASLAGAVAQRKAEAARIAQKVINESLITTNWSQSLQSGIIAEGQRQFRWTLRSDPWNQDPAITCCASFQSKSSLRRKLATIQ
jgi:hypothetical protein